MKGCAKRLGYCGNYDIHCGVNYLDGKETKKLDKFIYCKACEKKDVEDKENGIK